VINALKAFKLFLINKSEITIRTYCKAIVAYNSQQINTDKKSYKRWLLFQEDVYHNGIKINFEHIKGVKNVVADILSRFAGIQQNESLQGSYQNVKHKMKFGNQELPVLTNEFHYPSRKTVNDKFNCLIDNIWNIPKYTNNNEQFVFSVKKGIIYALYIFCIADNQGVPLLTKASPSRKGYTTFVLLLGPHKGVYTNFKDLCLAKEGIQSPIYKGFYSKEEAEKALN